MSDTKTEDLPAVPFYNDKISVFEQALKEKNNSYSQDELLIQFKQFKQLQQESAQNFYSSQETQYYLMSASWMSYLQQYLKPKMDEDLTMSHPGQFNKELLLNDKDEEFLSQNQEVDLKNELQENQDYQIVDINLMEFIAQNYQGKVIQRNSYRLQDGSKCVEIYLKKIQLIYMNLDNLKTIDHNKMQSIPLENLYLSKKASINDLKQQAHSNYVKKQEQTNFGIYGSLNDTKIENTRIWKFDSDLNIDQIFLYIKEIVKKTSTYDYRINMKGQLLESQLDIVLEEFNLSDTDIVLFEIRDENKNWNFTQEGMKDIDRCESCSKMFLELTISCVCQKVFYCTQECRQRDLRYHIGKCEKAGESEDDGDYEMKENSIRGLCGLSNLGNTCFMASALQCMSNINDLTSYFIVQKLFIQETNLDNPLGSKGKLAKRYASLLKNLWVKSQNIYSPYAIKEAVSSLNSIFQGYGQHDSSEFLSYILDGLHEDLNRVKIKQSVETIESNNRPDYMVAKQSWINHLKRNQSIIIDLMVGQFKSKLSCPECSRISITFDPFLLCSLPIPQVVKKQVEFFFINHDNKIKPYKMQVEFENPDNHTLPQFHQMIGDMLDKPSDSFQFLFLTYTGIFNNQFTNQLDLLSNLNGHFIVVFYMIQVYVYNIIVRNLYKIYHIVSVLIEQMCKFLIKIYLQIDLNNFFLKPIFNYYYSHDLKSFKTFVSHQNIQNQQLLSQNKLAIKPNTEIKTNDMRKISKSQNLFAVEFSKEDLLLRTQPDHIQISVSMVQESFSKQKKAFTFMRPFQFSTQNTTEEIEMKFFRYFRFLFEEYADEDEKEKFEALDDEQFYKTIVLNEEQQNQFYKINIISNTRSNIYSPIKCYFCQDTYCQNCSLQPQKTIQDLLDLIPTQDEKFKLEFEIHWHNVPNKYDMSRMNSCVDYQRVLKTKNKDTVMPLKQDEQQKVISIYDCFELFNTPEKLGQDNQWYCSQCKKHQSALKKIEIFKAPKILILHLKRFKQSGSILRGKNQDLVTFPIESLNLNNYLINKDLPCQYFSSKENNLNESSQSEIQDNLDDEKLQQEDTQNVDYDLIAVSNHMGNQGFGHYTAYCKNKQQNKWYEFNDSHVTPIVDVENTIVSNNAYLLFYERRN